MSSDSEKSVLGLGTICQWPGGYAMTLGVEKFRSGYVVLCCDGHATPGEAKNHGLARLIEVAARVADGEVVAWARAV